ncbi:MAG: cation diffusion facilitator family transporter [Deltaproteobacteria bacterium]|nr:cation diffusion facilitator family transporter [Deltaproteobacteria bacterium]
MDKGEKVALLAIGINLFLFGIKYTFSTLSGSIALKADAFHSIADVVASSTVFGGLIIAKRKTKSFPYGLYKVENLVSVMVALAIFYAGYEIVMEATKGVAVKLQNIWLTIASVLFIIAITYGYSRYATKVGKKINSPSLIADAKHIGVDMFSSTMVLVVLLSSFAGVNLDRISAFIIVVIIVWSGGKILIDGIRVLLDASLDYKTLSLAEKLILAEPQVMEIQHLMGRNSGRYKFIEADISLKTHDLNRAHFITNRIETNIKSQIKNVDRVLIHYEPSKKENFIYAVPLEYADQQRISRHFGEAPYFGLITVRIKDKKAIKQKVVANPFTQADHGKGILAAELLNKHLVDVVITKESFEGKGPYYVFSNAAVDNLITDQGTVEKALESFGIFF